VRERRSRRRPRWTARNVTVERLAADTGLSEAQVRDALRELEQLGYISRPRNNDAHGFDVDLGPPLEGG
jgi:DNA-binding IclR family transcriptional regulator